jgi:hypothetical protein
MDRARRTTSSSGSFAAGSKVSEIARHLDRSVQGGEAFFCSTENVYLTTQSNADTFFRKMKMTQCNAK